MTLPIRTTMTDITSLCGYLNTKPIGATVAEAKAVIDSSVLDGRKLNALKHWGLIETDETSGKIKLTDSGRALAKNKFAAMSKQLRQSIRGVPAYMAIVERAAHSKEYTVAANEIAAHWHKHFPGEASESERVLNDQAVCFFQIAEGADLGKMIAGRQGHSTRFEFLPETLETMIEGVDAVEPKSAIVIEVETEDVAPEQSKEAKIVNMPAPAAPLVPASNRVFITHGKNKKILEQVKEIAATEASMR